MAGSKNQNNKNKKNSANRRKSAETNTKGKRSRQKEHVEEDTFGAEITVWVLGAVMLILALGNFGICGDIMTKVCNFFFGIFGVIWYILPFGILFAAFFLHVNAYKRRAVNKVIFGTLVLICLGMISQLTTTMNAFDVKQLFEDGFQDRIGGGILCGSLAYLLHACVGTAGTYIIIVLVMILCVVFLAEISVIDLIKGLFEPDGLRDEEEAYEEPVRRLQRSRKPKKQHADFQEIVREDFPNQRDSLFTERKKSTSVLEQNVVLPVEEEKGMGSAKEMGQIPLAEDVHEITMVYDLPLPGEGMEDIAVTEISKEAIKKQEKKARKPRKKNVVSAEELQKETATTKSLQMENTTAKAVENISAKEVGTSDSEYRFPPMELLKKGKAAAATKEDVIRNNALKLQEVLRSFGVNVTMTNYSCGPSVTRYEMVPEQGVKVSKITGLADDIMMNLAAQSIRIEAPIPGKSAVGIEIPNDTRSGVGFRELIDTEKFIKHPSKIAFAVGKDIEGNVIVEDIAKMPHLLIAGATGSGKSVCTNTLIMSILYKARPDEVKLILVDPKQVELKVYNGIPHLLTPVVTDPKKAAGALNWAVAEMTKRYQLFSECNVRNIQGYNAKVEELQESGKLEEEKLTKMPQIVIIVDELADLMMVAKGEVEEAIVRLAQLARAAGIHLVIATQRPSVDVVTGLIKANVPSRIALSVSSGVDSRTIIDSVGAEKLLGNGDMLFYPTNYPKPLRVQGAYISDDEVVSVVEYLKAQNGETSYSEEVTNQITAGGGENGGTTIGEGNASNERDEYFVQAGRFIIEKNKASIGMLQRMFKIGFNRAARIMDQLFEAGVVGPEEGTKPRQVLMSEEQFDAYIDEYF